MKKTSNASLNHTVLDLFLAVIIGLGSFGYAGKGFKIQSLSVSLGSWETEVSTNNQKENESYYSLPKLSAGFFLFGLDGSINMSLENSVRNNKSDIGVNSVSLLMGKGYPLGPIRTRFMLGTIIPLRKPNPGLTDPFTGSGNLFIQSSLGLNWNRPFRLKNFGLASGLFFKTAVTESYMDAIARAGSFDGYGYVSVSYALMKKLKLNLESMYFYQQYHWNKDKVDEVKQSVAMGGGVSIPFLKRYRAGVKLGRSLWAQSELSLPNLDLPKESRSSFYYSFSFSRNF